jgi:sugar diacid utilization regulator
VTEVCSVKVKMVQDPDNGDFTAVKKGVNKPIKGVIVGLIGLVHWSAWHVRVQ